MPRKRDLTGQKYGKLTPLYEAAMLIKKGTYMWHCSCECSGSKLVSVNDLTSGNVKSCGCLTHLPQKGAIKHGFAIKNKNEYPFYQCFIRMHQRCENVKDKAYKYYGAKGIQVCERWSGENGFENFRNDMFSNWKKGLSIERINVLEDYSVQNCCWIPMSMQSRNRRNVKQLEYHGELKTLREIAKINKISYKSLHYYTKYKNLSLEESLNLFKKN